MNKPLNQFALVALAMLLFALPSTSQAATLDEAIGEITVKLSKYLTSKNESVISIGQFVGPPQLATTSGPNIAQCFQDHFKKHDIDVKRRASLGLRGEYRPHEGGDGEFGVLLSCSLVDSFGQVLTDFAVEAETVSKQEDVVDLLGATTALFPEDSAKDRAKDLKKSILNPSIHIEGNTKTIAKQGSPYAMEIVVNEHALPIEDDQGLGFVHIEKGDKYSIRLFNNSPLEAAVRLTIDGLSVFEFSDIRNAKTGKPKYTYYIIPPHKHIELKGWHKSNKIVHSFLVTSYSESAAATIDHKNDIGTITAQFSAAWPKGSPPPRDESLVGRGDKATGFGPPVEQISKEVEREVGRLRAAISIRYDR